MSWNIAPECISSVFLCIIWIYSRKGNVIPNLQNQLFQASFLTTFCAMFTNILSTILIYTLRPETLVLTWLVTLVYFIATPLMGMVYFFYTAANIFESSPKLKRYTLFASIPGVLYTVMVLLNPFTKHLFDISLTDGYRRGPLLLVTYGIFYLYCLACVFLVVFQGKRVAPAIRAILFIFPSIAGVVIIIQLLFPSIILSGSAATCALLLIYLYLQNKQIAIDYLTHLPNRREFLKMQELYIRKKEPFSMLVLSLREFKTVNDTYGQHQGDALLTALSVFLRKHLCLREGEVYRYSGDEFALLLKGTDTAALTDLVLGLHRRMARAWEVPGCTCLLSAAIGIASYPDTAEESRSLINGLEYAVAQAKQDPDTYKVCFCTPELLEKAQRRHIIAEQLEQCLKTDSFELHYQPIFSVETQRFIKAEALLRMRCPQLGPVSPAEFIPVAEESGLIIHITYLVLDRVCRFMRALMDEGLELESINVNFSALQFTQKDLLSRVLEIMLQNDVPCSKIKVELTESTLAENAETIATFLCQLNEAGIRIGLDDFGTGYSNLISVLDLPISTVKLDKSLVWSAAKDRRCFIALQNFSRAFRELGMTVLAEGVETEEQSRLVVDAGCTLIQGFLYAKPLPEEDFRAFLRAQQAATS